MNDDSGSDPPVSGNDRDDFVQILGLFVVSMGGSYAVARAVDPMTEYLSMTFGLAETSAGAWWLVRTVTAEAPLLVILLIAVATVTETRNEGLVWGCILPTALLLGMSVGLFGLQSGILAVLEPSLPTGILSGVVGWMLGMGITATTDRFSDDLRTALLGRWDDQRRLATLLGSGVLLLVAGYAIVNGAQLMTVYIERTIGLRERSLQFFLELYLVRAPLVVVFLLATAAGNALRGGNVVTSVALPTTLFLGMGFAVFGFPPKLLNVFYQAVPAGILLGILGWLLGLGAVRVQRTRHSVAP